MRFRKLRIAWSVAWGILCLLLTVLSVRSYWWQDGLNWVQGPSRNVYAVRSASARIAVTYNPAGDEVAKLLPMFSRVQHPLPKRLYPPLFQRTSTPAGTTIYFPTWLLAALIAAISAAPWFPFSKNFSLRTLLIATTLVAVVLGLIVLTTRK